MAGAKISRPRNGRDQRDEAKDLVANLCHRVRDAVPTPARRSMQLHGASAWLEIRLGKAEMWANAQKGVSGAFANVRQIYDTPTGLD